MSEFIKRIQDRLKSSQQALKRGSVARSSVGGSSSEQDSQRRLHKALSMPLDWFTPSSASKGLTYGLMLACALSATFWIMKITQIPGTPVQPANGISKGMNLFTNQDANTAYGLFGSKPLATENIYLRGVVITSKNPDGTPDGFAIFEIDGKPTNAMSVGESIGKGFSLKSIGDETATLLYQGQKLNFKLNNIKDKVTAVKNNSKIDSTKK